MIRSERPGDAEAIAAVTRAAFGRELEARIVAAIRASDRFVPELSLVADDHGIVVGHVILSYVDLGGRRILALGPISVAPERQRRGTGSALMREAIGRADERGEPVIVLLGHPWYYPRFGFRRASELGLEAPGEDIPDEAWMALPLSAYDPSLRGRVVLSAAFAAE